MLILKTFLMIVGMGFTIFIMYSTMGAQYTMWTSANTTANISNFTVAEETLDLMPLIWFGMPFLLFVGGIFWLWRKR